MLVSRYVHTTASCCITEFSSAGWLQSLKIAQPIKTTPDQPGLLTCMRHLTNRQGFSCWLFVSLAASRQSACRYLSRAPARHLHAYNPTPPLNLFHTHTHALILPAAVRETSFQVARSPTLDSKVNQLAFPVKHKIGKSLPRTGSPASLNATKSIS